MKTIKIARAGKVRNEQPEKINIQIVNEVPSFNNNNLHEKFFIEEANKLYDILINTLPQGVIHNLTIKLNKHYHL